MRNIFFSLSLFLSMVVYQNTGYSNPVENEQQQQFEETHQVVICDKHDKLTECITVNGVKGVRPLIETGANVNFQNYQNDNYMNLMRVLYYSHDHTEIVKILPQLDDDTEIVLLEYEIETGANVNFQNYQNDNYTNLMRVLYYSRPY